MSKEYNIGIYIRLSMADEDTGYGSKAESDSIGNQRISEDLWEKLLSTYRMDSYENIWEALFLCHQF